MDLSQWMTTAKMPDLRHEPVKVTEESWVFPASPHAVNRWVVAVAELTLSHQILKRYPSEYPIGTIPKTNVPKQRTREMVGYDLDQ